MKNTFEKSKKIFLEALKCLVNEDFNSAERKLLESYRLTPNRISIISNLIQIYIKLEDSTKLKNFLKKNDNFNDTFDYKVGLGFLEYFEKNHEESLNICKDLKPQNLKQKVQTINLKIKNLDELNKFDDVISLYDEILLIEKDNYINFYNFGTFLYKTGDPKKALKYLYKAFDLKNDFPGLKWNISLCELKLGNFKKGFSYYNYRWKNKYQNKKYQSIKELKNLNDLPNSRVLFWGDGDGGYGDNIQFSRFVKYLSIKNKNLTFSTYSGLKKLLENLSEEIKVISNEEVNITDYDYQISLGDVPKLLEFKKFEDIPYYHLNIQNTKTEKLLNLSKNKLNIGFAWCGNPKYPNDKYRSIPLNKFSKILKSEDFKFFKLQTLLKPHEVSEFKSYKNIEDIGEKNFYDLSKCLKELDIIISSDTSIIHLCGILNIKAYMLLNYNSDWRWFFDDKKTLWYPSIEIIKQKKVNDWDFIFKKLEFELMNLYKSKFKS